MVWERETAVSPLGDGRYGVEIDPSWSVVRGPNGGYVAALLLRAVMAEVDDPQRSPRSLTIHYSSPADVGPAEIAIVNERTGRSMTSCSARLEQNGRLVAMALAACSAPRSGPEFCDLELPVVQPASEIPSRAAPPDAPPIARRWDARWAIGAPPSFDAPPAAEAVTGGWLRLPERRVMDAPMVAAVTDAWIPPAVLRSTEPMFVPTVDLTIHFRSALPYPGAAADDFVLARFRTTVAAEGFLEEDGEVWAPDGRLLAQSRQLAAVFPYAPGESVPG
jgi:acyl-CoA thioesterase